MNLENLIATTQPTAGYLAYIFWYSIGGGVKIEREELKKKLIENNLEEDWLPNKIRAVDAFRKATKDIERKRVTSDPKIFENMSNTTGCPAPRQPFTPSWYERCPSTKK